MKHTNQDPEYQQSSRDASEEDAGDNDSITSAYDNTLDAFPPRQRKKCAEKPQNFDEGESSATTSDISIENRLLKAPKTSPVRAVDIVDKRYIDVNTASGRRMNPPPSDRPVRVYSDGIFDLFHLG
jgi:hypothetical protein